MSTTADLEALLPTDEDVAFYREHGYYISRHIFSDEELDAAVEGSERFYAGEFDPCEHEGLRRFMQQHGPRPPYGGLRKHDYASFFCRSLAAITRKPILGAIAARLAGTPQIRLWHDQLLFKPPQAPGRQGNVGWHTDRGYWQNCTSTNMLTAWVPFHACDEAIGTITMIDGSHRWPDNTAGLDFFSGDLEGLEQRFQTGGQAVVKTPMILDKGQVSFHHCLTIHGSGPNLDDRPRRSIAVHLQDADNRFREFTTPDGQRMWHGNCALTAGADGAPDFSDPAVCPVIWSGSA